MLQAKKVDPVGSIFFAVGWLRKRHIAGRSVAWCEKLAPHVEVEPRFVAAEDKFRPNIFAAHLDECIAHGFLNRLTASYKLTI